MKPRAPYFFPISRLAIQFWLSALVTFRHCDGSQERTSSKGEDIVEMKQEAVPVGTYTFFPRHWFGWKLQVTPAVTRTLLRSRVSGIIVKGQVTRVVKTGSLVRIHPAFPLQPWKRD